ncbi:hypothetical protein Tco_1272280 [Tanacetum coccineum]
MSGEEPATQIAPVESPQMVSIIKLPILKKGKYTLWSMRMEQYLTNTDYSLWQVILNGDGPIQVTTDEKGIETKAAIKSRFGGNVESKKMQKTVLKQQFENFSLFYTEGLDKAYDRFQKLINLLEVHGAVVPNEDANQKFLRALPSSWNNVALIIRNKDGIDNLDIDDLYNNLKVFEADIKEGAILQGNVEHQEIKETWNIDADVIRAGHHQKDCLESVEAQLVVHQKNKAVYEEKIAVLEFKVKDKSNAITRLKNQLDETLREKHDLKAKLEHVFDSHSNDGDDNQTNDRFKKDNRYHAVPPPLTGNYMPPLVDLYFARLDDSVYRPTTNKTSPSVSQVETSITSPRNTSVEMPRVESVRPSGVIIED